MQCNQAILSLCQTGTQTSHGNAAAQPAAPRAVQGTHTCTSSAMQLALAAPAHYVGSVITNANIWLQPLNHHHWLQSSSHQTSSYRQHHLHPVAAAKQSPAHTASTHRTQIQAGLVSFPAVPDTSQSNRRKHSCHAAPYPLFPSVRPSSSSAAPASAHTHLIQLLLVFLPCNLAISSIVFDCSATHT